MSIFKKLFMRKSTKIKILESRLDTLRQDYNDLKKDFEELSQRDDNSRDELIAGLDERLECVEEKTEDLNNYSLYDFESDISELKDLTDDLNYYSLTEISDNANEAKEIADEASDKVNNLSEQIDEINERLNDLENQTTPIYDDDELNAKLTDFNNRIVALEDSEKVAQIADIKQSLKDLFTKVLKALED